MCDELVWSLEAITSVNWADVMQAVASVVTAVVAFLALRSWRRQDKAKREAEFLDALIEAAHTYIAEMPKPITVLEIVKIGMKAHAPPVEPKGELDRDVLGAIAYIETVGTDEVRRWLDVLEEVQSSAIRLRSLSTKGQVFKFSDYAKCQNAVATLTRQYNRLEVFVAVISSRSWNWEHPEALKHLKTAMAIDPDEMRKSVEDNNVAIIEFASETYTRIYG